MYDNKIMRVTDYSHSTLQSAAAHARSRENCGTTLWSLVCYHSLAVNKNMEVGAMFDDFPAYQTEFKAFQEETKQFFVVKKSKSVDAVNKKLTAKSTKYKLDLKWTYLWYQCKRLIGHDGSCLKTGPARPGHINFVIRG